MSDYRVATRTVTAADLIVVCSSGQLPAVLTFWPGPYAVARVTAAVPQGDTMAVLTFDAPDDRTMVTVSRETTFTLVGTLPTEGYGHRAASVANAVERRHAALGG